jgi:hypothetical protein
MTKFGRERAEVCLMKRELDDDDDFDYLPPQGNKGSSNGLMLGLLIGGGVVVMVVAIGLVGLVSWVHEAPNAMEAPQAAAIDHQPVMMQEPARPTYTREEFARLVMGKTPDEVVAVIGRKADTRIERGNELFWSFHSVIRDPGDGQATVALVDFREGKVVKVSLGT